MSRKRWTREEIKQFRGVVIEVNSDGIFSVKVGGDYLTADTLKALENQVEKALKKTKVVVAVPVTELGKVWQPGAYARYGSWVSGIGVRRVTLTGLHSNGKVLAKDDNTGEREQLDGYGHGREVVRRLTSDEEARYVALATAKREAERVFYAFTETVKLPNSLRETVQEALGQKVDTPDEPVSPDVDFDDPRVL